MLTNLRERPHMNHFVTTVVLSCIVLKAALTERVEYLKLLYTVVWSSIY